MNLAWKRTFFSSERINIIPCGSGSETLDEGTGGLRPRKRWGGRRAPPSCPHYWYRVYKYFIIGDKTGSNCSQSCQTVKLKKKWPRTRRFYSYVDVGIRTHDHSVPSIEEGLRQKAKVVASVLGAEFIQFLTALAILHWTILRIGWIAPGWFVRKGLIHPILQNRPKQNS